MFDYQMGDLFDARLKFATLSLNILFQYTLFLTVEKIFLPLRCAHSDCRQCTASSPGWDFESNRRAEFWLAKDPGVCGSVIRPAPRLLSVPLISAHNTDNYASARDGGGGC